MPGRMRCKYDWRYVVYRRRRGECLDQEEKKKPRFPLRIRIISGVVAFALILSLMANAATAIRIQVGEATEAAVNYLVERTDYVNAGTTQRLQDRIQTISVPETLEDFYRLAGTQIAGENYQGALDSIESCILLDDGSDDTLHQDLLLKKGCLLVMLDRDLEALAPLDQVLEEYPEQMDALLVKAQIYSRQQDLPNLTQTLKRYLELDTSNYDMRLLLAQAMFAIEDYTGAAQQYRLVLEDPENLVNPAQVQYLYGLTCVQLGDFFQAEESLTAALEADGELEAIHYYIGICQMSREAYSEAVESFSISVEKESMLQLSHYSRGVCGLMIEGYDVDSILIDLQLAAEYTDADIDTNVSQQAALLLEQLTGIT